MKMADLALAAGHFAGGGQAQIAGEAQPGADRADFRENRGV